MKKTILIAAVFASFCIVSCTPGGQDKDTHHDESGLHEHEDGKLHDHATDSMHHDDADDHDPHTH